MLTGAFTAADTILGLDAGAGDNIVKLLRMDKLITRMRSHLRKTGRSKPNLQFEFHDIRAARALLTDL